MKLVSALLVCLVLVGCAHRPGAGSYLDAGTTLLALNSGKFIEAIKEEKSHREALESRIAALESGDEG